MKEFIHPRLSLLSALALACAPLHAEAINDTAAAPAAVAEQSAHAYAPAMLPQETEGVLFIPHLSQSIEALNACGSPLGSLQSIDSIAVSNGKGNAKAIKQLLALHSEILRKQTLHTAKHTWLISAKPEYRATITDAFDAELQDSSAKLKEAAKNLRVSPIYVAITATPGKEAEFDKLCSKIEPKINKSAAAKCCEHNAQAAEWQGFTGLQVPLKSLLPRELAAELAQDPDVSRSLNETQLFILCKKAGNAITFICCSDTADISLPTSTSDTLAQSPAFLASAQAGNSLLGSLWISAELQETCLFNNGQSNIPFLMAVIANAFQASMPQQKQNYGAMITSIVPALTTVFEKAAKTDAANAPAFHSAAAAVKRLQGIFDSSHSRSISKDTSLIVTQEKDNIHISATCDAMGLHYEAGVRHAASLEEAQDVILYTEGTKAIVPTPAPTDGISEALLHLVKGVTLTLEEKKQDSISIYLNQAEFFLPDANALGDAFKQVASGLAAPYSIIITAESPEKIAGAFYSTVENRAALAGGWDTMQRVIRSVATKFGLPANFPLPIMESELSGGATSYKLAIPLSVDFEPELCVSDKSLMLSTSHALSARLRALCEEEGAPFRGFAARLNFAPLFNATQTCKTNEADALMSKIHSISGSMVDEDGVLIQNWRIHLQKDAPAGE